MKSVEPVVAISDCSSRGHLSRRRFKAQLWIDEAPSMEIKAWVLKDIGGELLNNDCRWMVFLTLHCAALFQTALLLSADPEIAESNLLTALGGVDLLRGPLPNDLTILQRSVAEQCLKHAGSQSNGKYTKVRSLLQVGLWPVLAVDPLPRICFVLCILLGYAPSWCAQMLGVEEQTVGDLLAIAFGQLCFRSEEERDNAPLATLHVWPKACSAAGLNRSSASTYQTDLNNSA